MEKKSLIILGGSLYELPLLLAAKQKGFFIYLVDIDPNAAGHNVADVSINLSTKDIESIKRYIDSLSSVELKSIVGIGSVDSDVHATIAALSNHLNLKHFNYTLSEIITNKYKMYTLLRGYIENGYFTGFKLDTKRTSLVLQCKTGKSCQNGYSSKTYRKYGWSWSN